MSDEKPETAQGTRSITLDDMNLGASPESDAESSGPRSFLFAWFQLFKTAQIHAIENRALEAPVKKFVDVTSKIVAREGAASFQAKDGTLFLNSVKLNLSTDEYYEIAESVFDFFEDRGMGGFVVEGAFDAERVLELLRILVYAPHAERSHKKIQERLEAANLPFRVNQTLGVRKSDSREVVLERRAYTFLTYSKLVVLVRSLFAERD